MGAGCYNQTKAESVALLKSPRTSDVFDAKSCYLGIFRHFDGPPPNKNLHNIHFLIILGFSGGGGVSEPHNPHGYMYLHLNVHMALSVNLQSFFSL